MTSPKLYKLLKIPLRALVDAEYEIHIDNLRDNQFVISQQDNQLFRQIRLITKDDANFNEWIVFVDCNGISDKETPLSHIISNGFTINGEKYVLSERSASMTRNAIMSFVRDVIIDDLNERVTLGINVGETVLSKYYAYRGLMLSSCHCIDNWKPKVVIVKDLIRVVPNQRIKYLYDKYTKFIDSEGNEREWKQKDVKESVRDIEVNVFDGCGIHHPLITSYIKMRLGITDNPTSVLLRMPFIKGVTHEMDYTKFFAENGVTEIEDIWGHKHDVTPDSEPMFIMTESMYKGVKYFRHTGAYDDWEDYWRRFEKYNHCVGVTKWNFSKEREPIYTRGNYQILQDLDMPYDDFCSLADMSIEWADKVIGCDQLYTYCFLGLLADNKNSLNSYCKAILKNPAMMNEESVRQYIRNSISKYCDEFKCGKLWLRGAFKFLAPDLVALMQHIGGLAPFGCLSSGEFYGHDIFGDILGERNIERNPHICASEHVILNGVTNELTKWVSHLDNVCMINCWEIVQMRLQGADFDGDLVLVLDEPIYKSGVHSDAMPVIDVDDKITVSAESDTPENRAKIILRTMKNIIGECSNMASVYHNKSAKSDESRKKYESFVDIIAVVTGKSIDYAKTGVLYTVPRHISKYARPLPYFMKYRGSYYANQKLSQTNSNMNRLCRDVEKWDRKHRWERKCNNFDWSIMIDDSIVSNDYDDVYDKIKNVYLSFVKECAERSKFQAMCRNYEKYKNEISDKITKSEARVFEVDWGFVYDKYKEECNKICPNNRLLANIATRICYCDYPNKDKKFIWVVAENGVLENIKQVKHMIPERSNAGKLEYLGRKYRWVEYGGSAVDD